MDKPRASTAQVSQQMKEARISDTEPELRIRKLLFSVGLRFRIQYRVPGLSRRTIDVAFPRQRLAIFIDGCFWHGCVLHRTVPKSNRDWWKRKLRENRDRDHDTDARLGMLGWRVFRFWEHENPVEILAKIREALSPPCPVPPPGAKARKARC